MITFVSSIILQEMFGAEIKVVTSGNIWIDFIAPGTNKGAALSNLMKLFHIKPEECMAFGSFLLRTSNVRR